MGDRAWNALSDVTLHEEHHLSLEWDVAESSSVHNVVDDGDVELLLLLLNILV